MKKYFIFICLFTILLIPNVNAEDYSDYMKVPSSSLYSSSELSYSFNALFERYSNEYRSDYPYYFCNVVNNKLIFAFFKDIKSISYRTYLENNHDFVNFVFDISSSDSAYLESYVGGNSITFVDSPITSGNLIRFYSAGYQGFTYYDSNFPLYVTGGDFLSNFYGDYDLPLENGKPFPKMSRLFRYSSAEEYLNSVDSWTEVDLSRYKSVILTLKTYNLSVVGVHNTTYDLQVKGSIGITPVYNFGRTPKSSVTDRCNSYYSEYTDYQLFVNNPDLQNNAIFYVKACSDNTKFKFNPDDFNITYVTDENANDPVIAVDGKTYHVIPFTSLPSTANKNEEENFIPGQSGFGFSDVLMNAVNNLESVWSTITVFMSLVTKFFNTLPIEIRTIAITTFATSCTLGIIKILKS